MESARIRGPVGLGEWSIYGAVFFLASSIAASMLLSGLGSVLALAYVAVWVCLMSPEAIGCLRKRRYWFFVVSITLITTLAMGGEDRVRLAGVPLSQEGLIAGVGMALRATTIILATNAFARSASIGGLSALFSRLGVGEIGFLLGIAVNLVPLIQSTCTGVLLAMRLRGGFRRHRLQAAKRLIVTILVNSLRYSEEIVCAAEARAFNGTAGAPMPVPLTRSDGLLLVTFLTLMSCTMFLWRVVV